MAGLNPTEIDAIVGLIEGINARRRVHPAHRAQHARGDVARRTASWSLASARRSRRARPPRSPITRGDRGLPRRGVCPRCCGLTASRSAYGDLIAVARRLARGARGRDGGADRRQRRGQDDDAPRDLRAAAAPPRGASSSTGARLDGLALGRDRGARHRARARGAPALPDDDGAGEPRAGRPLGGGARAARRPRRSTGSSSSSRGSRERQRQLAGTLSGGEQQMCAIGRGLMARPRLLMLDEPSLGLAPVVVRTIFEILARINREGMTILLVEQNVLRSLAALPPRLRARERAHRPRGLRRRPAREAPTSSRRTSACDGAPSAPLVPARARGPRDPARRARRRRRHRRPAPG